MDKEKKSEIHITNNFNAPIGQHIDHVDTINFRMDGDGNFHFGMVENVKEKKQKAEKWEDLLPKELSSEEAKEMIETAIEAGLIEIDGYKLKWNKSKQLLAYYAEQMCKKLNIGKGEKTSWKPFENLFGEKDLRFAKQEAMRFNYRFEPNGYEEIDSIF